MAGRKIYYKVKVRICELLEKEAVRILNTGYVLIQDDKFEGYLALDYIEGIYNKDEEILSIVIHDINNCTEYFIFSGDMEELELPGIYFLETEVPNDNKICYLDFEGIEKNPIKQKEIEKTLQEIKKLHKIPN